MKLGNVGQTDDRYNYCYKKLGRKYDFDEDQNLDQQFDENGYSGTDVLIALGVGVGIAALGLFFTDRKERK